MKEIKFEKRKDLLQEERLLLLEEKMDFICDYIYSIEKNNDMLLAKIDSFSKKNEKWANEMVSEFKKLYVSQANLSIIFDTVFKLTDNQKNQIQQRILNIKSKTNN